GVRSLGRLCRPSDLPHESWALGRGGITPTRGDRPWHASPTTMSSRSPRPNWSANRATPSRRPLRAWASTQARSALGPESPPRRRHHRPPTPPRSNFDGRTSASARRTAGSSWSATFKKSDGLLREGAVVKFAFIRDHQAQFPVEVLCEVLQVSRSGYYAWTRRLPSPSALR